METSKYDELYFNWLVRKIADNIGTEARYTSLLSQLHSTPFEVTTVSMDENRISDGYSLRDKFAFENGMVYQDVEDDLAFRQCSTLEVLVAMAIRAEQTLTSNVDYGDRTYMWFWDMLNNLCVLAYDDSNYNFFEVGEAISRFINRTYGPSGKGGPFDFSEFPEQVPDVREVELWYQLQWYAKKYFN